MTLDKDSVPGWVAELWNQSLHVIVGAFILAPAVISGGAWWGCLLTANAIAIIREDAQHRNPDDTPEGWSWVRKGWPASGRWLDIWCWTGSGLVVWLGKWAWLSGHSDVAIPLVAAAILRVLFGRRKR